MEETAWVGVDLGGTNVRAGKMTGQEISSRAEMVISARHTQEAVLAEIFAVVDRVFDKDVAGIGMGVPSVVDIDRGIVYTVENIPSWKEVHLRKMMEDRYGVPVTINNDANAFALGECYFGRGRECKNLVGLTIGTGLGAGIVIDRKLYAGSHCGAGEIGSIPYRERTLEYFCSGQWFLKERGIRGDIAFERACKGDWESKVLYAEFGRYLADAIMIVLYAYDPQMIVLGGSVSQAFPFFGDSLKQWLKRFPFAHILADLRIERSEMSDMAIYGAAALAMERLAQKN